MNDRAQIPSQLLLSLAALRDKAMAADSLNALAFGIANDLYPLLRFRQALVFAQRAGNQVDLLCVSGLAKPQEDSPYLVWLRRAVAWLAGHIPGSDPVWLAREGLAPPPEVADGWAEWWPAGACAYPSTARTASAWAWCCSCSRRRRRKTSRR